MGPAMCLMSICMFATIRCPFQKKDKGTSPQNYTPSNEKTGYQPAQPQQQFQNIDNGPNYNYPQAQPYTGQPQLAPIDHKKHGLDI